MNTETAQEVSFDEITEAVNTLQYDGKPVTIEAVRGILGKGSSSAIHQHLVDWRASHSKPVELPKAEIPESLLADLARWAQQYAEDAGAGSRDKLEQAQADLEALLAASEDLEAERDELQEEVATITAARDQALVTVTERDEEIERLNAELRNAKQVAMDALVSKAKDQLAIEGKDAQISDLRAEVERYVASQSSLSDARLRAEMELVGAVTARDSLEAEVKNLRAQLGASLAERSSLRAEVEVMRKQ